METAASFEARFAPSSYPTEPLGRSRTPLQGGALRSRRPDTERDYRVRLRGARRAVANQVSVDVCREQA